MTIDDKIRDEKLQQDINWKAAKVSALSSRKIDKGEEILPLGPFESSSKSCCI